MAQPQSLVYDTNVLIRVIPNLKIPSTFLLDKFFPTVVAADTEFVSIDVEIGKRRMSPFVSPLVEGKLVESMRIQTNTFKPAYIKDKRAPDLRRPVRRSIGERIGGDMTGAAREAANLEYEMTDQVNLLTRRLEWMAAQVLMFGGVTISGDGFPAAFIDFGRDARLTVANSSTTKWTTVNITAGTSSPTSDIENWQRTIMKMSGAQVTDIIFTTTAWAGFIQDPLLKGAVYYPKLGDYGNTLNVGPQITRGGIYKGRWGQYDLWVYNEWYVDNNDVEQPMIPDGSLIFAGQDIMGTRAFGMILDPAFNYASMPFAPKTWVSEDPPQRYLMMQSAPLVIPTRPNASMGIVVADPVYT